VIHNEAQLDEVKAGDRIWGKLPEAYFDVYRDASTPSLPELVTAAITALNDDNENGFFLMVEGSAVDGGGHANNTIQNVSEFIAFDEACKIAIEFAKTRTDTIVVIAPDHDTGGLYYEPKHLYDIVYDTQNGLNSRWAHWESDDHTTRNGGIFIYAPEGVPYPDGIDPNKADLVAKQFFTAYGNFITDYPEDAANVIDNTEIVKYIADLIDADLDEMTDKLFVDVTDLGTYDAESEVFAFHEKDVTIKRNATTAYFEEEANDLNGEIAVYIEGRFYVPAQVLTIGEEPELPEVPEEPEIPEEPEVHICPSAAFEDLDVEQWYHLYTDYALENGLMRGVSENSFAPNATLTRAMLVTILYSLEGKPATNKSTPFADVTPSDWYAAPVTWAQQNGIVSGTSATTFSPNANITREQIAVILYKYAAYKGMNTLTLDHNLHADDADMISDYAISAMNWAVGKGLITGKSATTLNPLDNATRAEIATILYRFIETQK
ncbi:MAG: S-layer homology domain-containing protein, partial [Oscillospiraceae bacterium]|nr:S-layer homology domain-containing protein [Oscillospiraceae bacterium]